MPARSGTELPTRLAYTRRTGSVIAPPRPHPQGSPMASHLGRGARDNADHASPSRDPGPKRSTPLQGRSLVLQLPAKAPHRKGRSLDAQPDAAAQPRSSPYRRMGPGHGCIRGSQPILRSRAQARGQEHVRWYPATRVQGSPAPALCRERRGPDTRPASESTASSGPPVRCDHRLPRRASSSARRCGRIPSSTPQVPSTARSRVSPDPCGNGDDTRSSRPRAGAAAREIGIEALA